MAENSIFWDTTTATGDGASEYTQAELIRWLRQTFIGDNTDEGVLKNYQNELEVTDAGGADVQVDTGGAYVYGFPYWNTAAVTKTLDTPSSDPRIDRIVLEADWTTQTVRITVVKGTEAAVPSAPALTQTDGTEWQISLAQVQIGTDGDIDSVTDERVFLHPNIEVVAAMMASVLAHASDHERAGSDEIDGDHLDIDWSPSNYTPSTSPSEADDADDLTAHLKGIDDAITDAPTREIFAPATYGSNAITQKGDHAGIYMDSGDRAGCEFLVPHDFSSISSAVAVVIPGSNSDSSWDIDLYTDYSGNGEGYQTHNESDEASTYNLSTDDDKMREIDISGVLSSLAAGDYVGFEIQNNEDPTHPLHFLGVRLRYT